MSNELPHTSREDQQRYEQPSPFELAARLGDLAYEPIDVVFRLAELAAAGGVIEGAS